MILELIGNTYKYECEKVIRIFYPLEKITEGERSKEPERFVSCRVTDKENETEYSCCAQIDGKAEEYSFSYKNTEEITDSIRERLLAKAIIRVLCAITGIVPPWGILTGIRPSKLMRKYISEQGEKEAECIFREFFEASEEKTQLAKSIALLENQVADFDNNRSFSLYVSIPFCPTRCSYCSFVSHSVESAKKLIPEYIEKLCEEIAFTGEIAKKLKLHLETVYIGGGTPTSLEAEQLKIITDSLNKSFDMPSVKEFTVEAGRPDTITEEKLSVLKSAGVTRISINPQTFSDSVLEAIGRRHSARDVKEKFALARKMGFNNINMDFIAGLPTDNIESFRKSLDTAVEMNPENITVHTLSVKRSSRMNQQGDSYCSETETEKMVEYANDVLSENGYIPYYMYRQSKTSANLENVGWCKNGRECAYNIFMMEECHTILACGAGAVTKLKDPDSNVIERIFNFKYPYEYNDRLHELFERKKRIKEFYSER